MAGKYRRRSRKKKLIRICLAVCAVLMVQLLFAVAARVMELKLNKPVENAGLQMTAYNSDESAAQVFMNDRWYRQKDVETLLVIGIDDSGAVEVSDSYNNTNQADFLILLVRDDESGGSRMIHLNRDTMADITMLGVTGEAAGMRRAQLALAYNYGQGQQDSSRNTAAAVSRLLYGVEIDHYCTMTMDAVPIMNDWAGGVTVEIMDDMTGVDSALVLGEKVRLTGEQALAYVRGRIGLDDSTNINRMERQRQYASLWVEAAQEEMKDINEQSQLFLQMSNYYFSDCTVQDLARFVAAMGDGLDEQIHELPGEAVKGEKYMEFHADDAEIQQLVLSVFYEPVN